MENDLIITCPVCGFSFKPVDSGIKKKSIECPICGFKFTEPDMFPQKLRDFDKKFI